MSGGPPNGAPSGSPAVPYTTPATTTSHITLRTANTELVVGSAAANGSPNPPAIPHNKGNAQLYCILQPLGLLLDRPAAAGTSHSLVLIVVCLNEGGRGGGRGGGPPKCIYFTSYLLSVLLVLIDCLMYPVLRLANSLYFDRQQPIRFACVFELALVRHKRQQISKNKCSSHTACVALLCCVFNDSSHRAPVQRRPAMRSSALIRNCLRPSNTIC
jgi:hypothetical protein